MVVLEALEPLELVAMMVMDLVTGVLDLVTMVMEIDVWYPCAVPLATRKLFSVWGPRAPRSLPRAPPWCQGLAVKA